MSRLRLAVARLRARPGAQLARVLAWGLGVGLPALVVGAVAVGGAHLRARAAAVPLVIGAPGDHTDLALAALRFDGRIHGALPVSRASLGPRARTLPLRLGHRVGETPVVGTDAAVFALRGLRLAVGRPFVALGEAVAGARAAERAGLRPGDQVQPEPPLHHDLAGAMPLVLSVVGVAAPTGGPEDDVLLVDLVTTWALDGHLHGHTAAGSAGPTPAELAPGTFLLEEARPEDLAAFHAHADPASLPVSLVLVHPRDARSHDQLWAELSLDPALTVVRPARAVDELLDLAADLRDLALLLLLPGVVGAFALLLLVERIVAEADRAEDEILSAAGVPAATARAIRQTERLLVGVLALGVAATVAALGPFALVPWALAR